MLSLSKIEQGNPILLSIEGTEYPIKVAGTCEKPWFCGKDVCKILGYRNPNDALTRHVQEKHKGKLQDFRVRDSRTLLHQQNVSHYDLSSIYISEPGLYSLVMRSKVPFAQKFQDLVYEEILPSIRKEGQYKLTKELEDAKQAAEDAKQAAEDAKQEVEEAKQVAEAAKQAIEEKETAIASIQSKLDFESKKALHLKQMILNEKARTPDQIVYIATTKQYAANNRFKVGGCKSRAHLRNRLNQYNSGRPVGDKMYFAAIFECVDYVQTESRIKSILGLHREVSDAEVYNLHYTALQHWVEFLVERYNEEISTHKSKLDELLGQTLTSPPVIPEPLILNGVEFRLIKNGKVEPKVMIDLDEMSLEEKQEWVLNVIEKTYPDKSVIERKELFDKLIQEHGAKFNKSKMWPVIKTLTNCRGFKVVY